MKLICLKCKKGNPVWVDPEVESLDGDMICSHCGHVYHGMGDYIQAGKDKEREHEERWRYPLNAM
jgi:hypothetical protein